MCPIQTFALSTLLLLGAAALLHGQQGASGITAQTPRYSAGVEMVNVTATVSDPSGRFVPNLTRDDFLIRDDNIQQTISFFSAERVPVSLGLVVDVSGSMAGEKIEAARAALSRFVSDLLGTDDEIFIYRFNDEPVLLQDWTSNRATLSRALGRLSPSGGTALYDAVAEALPLLLGGRHPKKALVIISDGNDTSSHITLRELQSQIRESGALVYAVGIDADPLPGGSRSPAAPPPPRQPNRPPMPPFPPRPGGPGRGFPGFGSQVIGIPGSGWPSRGDDRVNVPALRELTDDSGGRTTVVTLAQDLNPATASIADELRRQYELAYAPTTPRDKRWHAIRVTVRNGDFAVRARRGYVAN